MKIALISDIHGNLSALETILSVIRKEGADRIVCAGDIVGYGPRPNECLELLMDSVDEIVAGNHDWAAAGLADINSFNSPAREAMLWTQEMVSEADTALLSSIPLERKTDKYLLVHASPARPQNWDYILSVSQAEEQFRARDFSLCFYGHTHQPVVYFQDEDGITGRMYETEIHVKTGYRYLINLGSVGQPRDGSPLSCLGFWDTDKSIFTMTRVEYPVKQTQKEMRHAGLPDFLIDRLATGR